jgi:hypothetical protein
VIRVTAVAILLLVVSAGASRGQEIDATVAVDRSRISGNSYTYLNDLGEKIERYLNNHDWIDPRFEEHERIDVAIQITLLGAGDNYDFEANIVINSRRPIYNSLQPTSLFLYNDENWVFTYPPNKTLIHDPLQFDSITTLLDFYVYIILGYDFDSFSELGGTPYFNRAQNLVAVAQIGSAAGWSQSAGIPRSRDQLVSSLLSPNYLDMRRAMYVYHRLGLDRFLDNPDEAREQIIRALELIRETKNKAIGNLLFNTFFDAKYREIVSIFEDAPMNIRQQAYSILADIDQSHLSEYERLR